MLAFVSLTRSEWVLAYYRRQRARGHCPAAVAGNGATGAQVAPDGTIPMTGHDISLDLFTTPDQLMSGQRPFARPPGILWDEVDEEKTSTIPVLRERRRGSR